MPDRHRSATSKSETSEFIDERTRAEITNREAFQLDKKSNALERNRSHEQQALDRKIGKALEEIEFLKRESFDLDQKFLTYSDINTSGGTGKHLNANNKNDHYHTSVVTSGGAGQGASDLTGGAELKTGENELMILNEQVKAEIDELNEINQNIVEIKGEIDQLNSKLRKLPSDHQDENKGGDCGSKKSAERALHLSKEKCSRLRTENSAMRNKIKASRDEYRILNENLKKIDQNLTNKQRLFNRLCHEASQFQEERQESTNRIRALNERGKKILNSLENEEKSLSRAISNELKLREYLEGKSTERQGMSGFEAAQDGGEKIHLQNYGNGDSQTNMNRIDSPTTKKALSDFEIFMQKVSGRESMKMIKSKDRLSTLIDRHSMKEKINFSKFNQINRINSEIEKIQHAIESLKMENKLMEEENVANQSNTNDELKSLDQKINHLNSSIGINDERSSQDEMLLANTIGALKSLCTLTGVDMMPVIEIVGENGSNSINCLVGQMEKQLNLLLRIFQQQNHPSGQDGSLTGNLPNSNNQPQTQQQQHRGITSAKSKQLRVESAFTNRDDDNAKSFDLASATATTPAGAATGANGKIGAEHRPDTSPMFEKLQGIKDFSDVDYEMARHPLSRVEILEMIRENEIEAQIDDEDTLLVPSNHSLEINQQ